MLLLMFDLGDAHYDEGAPMEWRRWLTPGTPVVLRFEDVGLTIIAEKDRARIAWDSVARLSVRGSDTPEHVPWPGTGNLLASLVAAFIVNAGSEFRRCWFAIVPTDGAEMIFEVQNLLRPELERLLDEHSG